ncbi:MAG: LytTR family DNA-binding domain-containing protein [Bacteroidota bacterium]
MKLRSVIIDDEKHSIDTLKFDLERCAKDIVEVVGTFENMKDALLKMPGLQPDIIFSDIDMPSINGIEGMAMADLKGAKIIFTTAHSKFAIDAIKVGAYDYLLKPIRLKELDELMQKVYKEVSNAKSGKRKIAVPTSEGLELLDVMDILFAKAESNYTVLNLKDGNQLTVGKTLKYFQNKLPSSFLRIHQSYLVNVNHIKKYLHQDGGSLLLKGQQILPVSKSYKDSVKAVLSQLF